jgi:hypothetical protein
MISCSAKLESPKTICGVFPITDNKNRDNADEKKPRNTIRNPEIFLI